MSYNAADEKKVKEGKQKVNNERNQELADVIDILKRPSGVRFFRRLMADGKIFSTTFTGNSSTFFNEGARNLVLRYFDDVCIAAPSRVAELMIKKKEEQNASDILEDSE